MIIELSADYATKDYPLDVRFIERSVGDDEESDFFVRPHDSEILIVNNGEVSVICEDAIYTAVAGQVIVIRNGAPRRIVASSKENTAYYRIVFDPSFITDLRVENDIFSKYYKSFAKQVALKCLVLDEANLRDATIINTINDIIVLNMTKKFAYEIYSKGLLCKLFAELMTILEDDSISYNGRNVPSRDEFRVKSATDFLQTEYANFISLSDIADYLHVSKNECCRCFKRVIGVGPIEYLIMVRIYSAARILYKDPLSVSSISELAINVGFNNISYFNKTFKKYFECTPTEFSNMIKKEPAKAMELFDRMQQSVEII